jgi:hypothetical protein
MLPDSAGTPNQRTSLCTRPVAAGRWTLWGSKGRSAVLNCNDVPVGWQGMIVGHAATTHI